MAHLQLLTCVRLGAGDLQENLLAMLQQDFYRLDILTDVHRLRNDLYCVEWDVKL